MIRFFQEDTDFRPPTPLKLKRWISRVVRQENFTLKNVNYIFCSDTHLLDINQQYLQHNTFTDIITFDQSTSSGEIQGDIFISIDRVKENALTFKVPFEEELHRVMLHGILHLTGYNDKSPEESLQMRKKEEAYLSLYL